MLVSYDNNLNDNNFIYIHSSTNVINSEVEVREKKKENITILSKKKKEKDDSMHALEYSISCNPSIFVHSYQHFS